MAVKAEQVFKYPNDDGKHQRAWVTDYKERERSACERVLEILQARPWLGGGFETRMNDGNDQCGIDVLVLADARVMAMIGGWGKGQMLAVQVKSSERKQRKFKTLHQNSIFNLKEKKHIFVLDGQDAKDVIAADLTAQMIILAGLAGITDEEGVLNFLESELGDGDLVQRYRENRELIVMTKWYKSRLK